MRESSHPAIAAPAQNATSDVSGLLTLLSPPGREVSSSGRRSAIPMASSTQLPVWLATNTLPSVK